MIKISIDSEIREEIEKNFWEDAKRRETGIFKILATGEAKVILQKNHTKLYNLLFDTNTDKVRETVVRELLFADKSALKKYIALLGMYEKKQSEELLNNIFRYDTFAESKACLNIMRKVGIRVCPYCNRQYIFTVPNGKMRPQIDHYFPKSTYPYLALSLYNMIPSCSICNMAKGSLDTYKEPILYPYEEEMGEGTSFVIKMKKECNFVRMIQGLSDDFGVDFDYNDSLKKAIVSNQIKRLHLKELYNEHKEDVKAIIQSKYINTNDHINELLDKFPYLFSDFEDVKNLMYMRNVSPPEWKNGSLSKFIYDIDQQLENGILEKDKE